MAFLGISFQFPTIVIALFNIIFSVVQLFLVGFSLGQTATLLSLKQELDEAIKTEGVTSDPTDSEDVSLSYSSDEDEFMIISCLAVGSYLIVASWLHLAIGIFLLVGAKQKSIVMCQMWLVVTLVFLVAQMFSTISAIFVTETIGDVQRPMKLLGELFLAVFAEGCQFWIVYTFVEEQKTEQRSQTFCNCNYCALSRIGSFYPRLTPAPLLEKNLLQENEDVIQKCTSKCKSSVDHI